MQRSVRYAETITKNEYNEYFMLLLVEIDMYVNLNIYRLVI